MRELEEKANSFVAEKKRKSNPRKTHSDEAMMDAIKLLAREKGFDLGLRQIDFSSPPAIFRMKFIFERCNLPF
ncbi:MAG: hypothetical protein R2769_14520 [Saprospiraceae bacterium]